MQYHQGAGSSLKSRTPSCLHFIFLQGTFAHKIASFHFITLIPLNRIMQRQAVKVKQLMISPACAACCSLLFLTTLRQLMHTIYNCCQCVNNNILEASSHKHLSLLSAHIFIIYMENQSLLGRCSCPLEATTPSCRLLIKPFSYLCSSSVRCLLNSNILLW